MYSTVLTGLVRAPRAQVYAALLDAAAVGAWRVPDGMSAKVHEFEPREGGRFRVTLTYDDPAQVGKTDGASDTYRGTFTRLVPGELVAEETEFETDDPALQGVMRMTTTLRDVPGGTEVEVRHDGVPDLVPPDDNELGTRMALTALAAYVESAG